MIAMPKRPIPEPLRGIDSGSFAHHTVVERLPDILRNILAENDFSWPIVQQLESFIEEIPYAQIRPLNDPEAPDTSQWAQYVEPYLGLNWLQIPWFLAETYFYRRILALTGYFKPGEGYQVDPFAYQKKRGLETAYDETANVSTQLDTWTKQSNKPFEFFATLLTINLWGNQADLSLWPAGHDNEQPKHTDLEASQSHILVNDTNDVVDHLAAQIDKSPRIDFIVDNAGFELVSDLALTDFFLSNSLASTIVLHLKYHPTFVSDAVIKDVEQTIDLLAESSRSEIRNFGQRLQAHIGTNRLQLQNDLFWTSPLSFWEMPARVRQELAQSNLLVSKGDANYRRLLGDRHWSYSTPFADIVSYLPTPLVALRTFKSEVAAGLEPEQIKVVEQQDSNWLTNGKRGVIQFVD
jgi:uncharacterized protein with ATP-grasp and redox domains